MPAIPYTKTATTDGAWDAGANVKRLPGKKAALRAAHAWVSADGDPDAKGSYKFPHHEVHGNGTVGAANTRACSAIIAALNGGRGGAALPDADRTAVYRHAAAHLKAAGKEAPELKSLDQIASEQRGDDEVERRVYRGTVELEQRDGADEAKGQKIRGYAAVFNQETMIGSPQWGFREIIAPGAFTDAIKQDDVRALFNHDANYVLGRNKSGTLRLVEDDNGLVYDIDPPDTQVARDLISLLSRGDVDASSFAFRVIEDKWQYTDQESDERPLRTVLKVELFDVSPVTYPAYPQTTSGVSARAKHMANQQHETRLRRDDSGDGDSGVDAATKTLVDVAHRDLMTAHHSVRKALAALGITGVPDQEEDPLTGEGGSGLDTGRSKRDGSGGDSAMYYAGHAMRHGSASAVHSASQLRALCRDANDDDGSGDGDGATGSDAGGAGANAATHDLDLRTAELELELLR